MIQRYWSRAIKLVQWGRIGLSLRRLKTAKPAEREQAQQALAALLADSRGLAMKIGQIMAGSHDDNAFQALVTSIEPLPLSKVKTCLGKPLERALQAIDEASAAASLGQVHHGLLHNGSEVAIKIRYPGIVTAIKAELNISGWLPAGGPIKRWQFDANDYKTTLHRQLLRETDYRIERQTQQRFRQNLTVSGLHIPTIYPEWCNEGVLVQSWEKGCRFSETCHWPKQQRLEIGRTLLMALWQSLFVHGEVHGDPHPGNYLFRLDSQGHAETVLLDYGCTVLIARQRRLAFLKLIEAYCTGQNIDAFGCFVAMGFNADKLAHLQEQLPELCTLLLRPLLASKPFPVAHWQLSAALQSLLGEKRWWFRAAGPADLMLLLRAFHGVNQQLAQLDVALPWWPLLKNAVGAEVLEQARQLDLPTTATANNVTARTSARRLCVRIWEDGLPAISMDLPPEAATDLASLIPSTVLAQLNAEDGLDLPALSQRLQREGISPQDLFNGHSGSKHYRVWLE